MADSTRDATPGSPQHLTLLDLGGFLLGLSSAIQAAAAARSTLPLGALLVLTAALAREYDGAYLLRQPWLLVLPFAASIFTSALLFVLVCAMQWIARRPASWLSGYPTFFSLYWLTAPLAWLYAIPVERFLSPVDATIANLWLLALVAAWRVAVMSRILYVAYGLSAGQAVSLVLWFGSSVTLVVLYLTPIPIFNVMGGLQLAPQEQVIQSTAVFVGFAAGFAWLIFLGSLVLGGLAFRAEAWPPRAVSRRWSGHVWCAGMAVLVAGLVALRWTQPEQRRRWEVERLMRSDRVDDAVAYLSRYERDDFPPSWDPPPRMAYGEWKPPVEQVLESCLRQSAKPWVRKLFFAKLERRVRGMYHVELPLMELLVRLPEGPDLIRAHPDPFEVFVNFAERKNLREAARARELVESVGLHVEPVERVRDQNP